MGFGERGTFKEKRPEGRPPPSEWNQLSRMQEPPRDSHHARHGLASVCLPSRPLQNGSSPRVDRGWAGDGLHMHMQGSRHCDLRGRVSGRLCTIFLGLRAFGRPGCWVAEPATRVCGFRQSTCVTGRPERAAQGRVARRGAEQASRAEQGTGAARRVQRWRWPGRNCVRGDGGKRSTAAVDQQMATRRKAAVHPEVM